MSCSHSSAALRAARKILLAAGLALLIYVSPSIMAFGETNDMFPGIDQLPAIKEMPDPLVKADGTRVTTIEQWKKERRPELVSQFQHYMYGIPAAAPRITATVEREDHDIADGKATMKQVSIDLGPVNCPKIHLISIRAESTHRRQAAGCISRSEFHRQPYDSRRQANRACTDRLDAGWAGGRWPQSDRCGARNRHECLARRADCRPRLCRGDVLLRRYLAR